MAVYTSKKHFFIVCFYCFSMSHIVASPQKHVIGVRPFGLFANFWTALNNLVWCVKEDKIPVIYWGDSCLYYTPEGYNGHFNVWEYYFEPVSSLTYEENDPLYNLWSAPNGYHIPYRFTRQTQPSKAMRLDIYEKVIKPFIKLNPIVQKKVNDFIENKLDGKHTIGIHLRGTDKCKEIKQVPPELILQEAQQQAGPDTQFFVATDEQALLELAKRTLTGTVVHYDSYRSPDGKSLHHEGTFPMHIIGEQVVIEVMLLAQCDILVHTCSYVSTAVLFLNPHIENILMSAG